MSFLSLFTTSASAKPAATTGGVTEAVRTGAGRSGVSFDYLLQTARRESSLDPSAKASTSTATGLFQFIEQTWLATVKSDGAKHGLQQYAEAITMTSSGRMTVADPAMRGEILALRKDPTVSAALAGELARRNGAALSSALGRQTTDADLYLAHVMGARGAASLISRAESTPAAKAAQFFPDEAAANRGLFYHRSGEARSLAEVRQRLAAGFNGQQPTVVAASAAADAAGAAANNGAWLSFFPQAAQSDGSRPLDVLFQTAGARGPVSREVAQLWTPSASLDSYFALQPADAASRGARPSGKPLDLLALMKPIAA